MKIKIVPLLEKLNRKMVTVDEIENILLSKAWIEMERKENIFTVVSKENSYKSLQTLLEDIKNIKIKGIDGIARAIIREEPEGFVIYTEGSHLAKVLDIEGIDVSRTTTNGIVEIYEVLGIEAARNAIINEASRTLQEQGLTVDIRHIMLVADVMTCDGEVKAIGRHGISGKKSSVLARAAFEITSTHLLQAGIIGEVDNLAGVAENIIVGQPVTLGTGAVNLIYKPMK
jgi:DNA-directed RNA polymerase subunit A"